MRKWTWPGVFSVLSQAGLWMVLVAGGLGLKGCNPTPTPPDPVQISLPATLQGDAGKQIKISADTEGVDVAWVSDPPGHLAWSSKDSKDAVVSGSEGLQLSVYAVTSIQDKKDQKWKPVVSNKCVVTFGKAPDPGPVPPGPTPTPLPTDGFRVLIVRPSNGQGLSANQVTMLSSPNVRAYLTGKCVKVANQAEYRMFDSTQDLSKESKIWQDAMSKARSDMQKSPTSKAWLLAINTKTGVSTPLPDTEADLLKALTAIGG